MAKRYFNWPLAIVLVVGAAVLVVSALALHGWKKNLRAEQALPLGEAAYASGDWDEAARQYGRYISIHNDRADIILKYADAQMNRRPSTSDNFGQARRAYSSILQDSQSQADYVREAATALIRLDMQRDEPADAAATARTYLEKNDDPTVRRLLASALRARKQWGEAVEVLAGLIEDYPDDVSAYEAMGWLAEERPGDVNAPANVWFDEAVQRHPNSALAHIIRADALLRRNDPNQALLDLEQAKTLDLSDVDVRLRLVASLANAGQLSQASEQLYIARDEAPGDSTVYETWATLALLADDPNEMVATAEAALEDLPGQPWDFLPVAAELYLRAGQVDQAEQCVARLQEESIYPEVTAYLQGRIAFDRGQVQAALNHWTRAIGVGYNDYLSLAFGAPPVRMAVAGVYEQQGDLRSAINQVRSFVSEMSELSDPRADALVVQGNLNLGRLLAEAGDWAGALDAARLAGAQGVYETEATALQIQARIGQLVTAGASSDDAGWQTVETQLNELEQTSGQSLSLGLLRVQAAAGQGQFERAGRLLDELGDRYPRQPQVAQRRAALFLAEADQLRELGQNARAAEKERDAVVVLRQAVEVAPQSVTPVLDLASLLSRQGKTQEAEAVLRDALTRISQPQEHRQLGLWLASAYGVWGQTEKRLEWLRDLERQYPTDIDIKRGLLSLRTVLNDSTEAQRLVDEIKEIEGDRGWRWRLEQARVWVQQAYTGNSEGFKGRYAEIIRLLQENLEANPEDTASRLLLGQAYDLAGEYGLTDDTQLALETYQETLARDPENAVVVARTVRALINASRQDEAERVLNEAERRGLYHPDFAGFRLSTELGRASGSPDSQARLAALGRASDILEGMVADDPNDDQARVRLALLLAQQGRFDEAQAVVDDLLVTDPNATYAKTAQIQLYIEQGDEDRALQASDKMVAQLKSPLAHAMRARTYAAFNMIDEALADLTRAVELQPEAAAWWLIRADYSRLFGRTEQAIADARKALELAPESVNARRLIVTLLVNSGLRSDAREAQEILDQALVDTPRDPELRLFQAKLLLRAKTTSATDEARRLLTGLTQSHPDIVEAWVLLGRLELDEGNPGTAIVQAIQGLRQAPNNASLLLLKADAEFDRSPAVAISTLTSLAEMYPQSLDVTRRLALAYTASGDLPAARRLIAGCLADREGEARQAAVISLAEALYNAGDPDEAKRLVGEVAEARPDDPNPLVVQIRLSMQEQDWNRAEQLLRDWCAGHPDDVQVPTTVAVGLIDSGFEGARRVAESILRGLLANYPEEVGVLQPLAILLQLTGQGAESAQLNQRILEIDPNNVTAANNLAWYLAEDRGRFAEALEYANAGLALDPDHTDMRDTRGVIYYRLGRYEDAVADFAACVRQYGDNDRTSLLALAHFHLGRTYVALGNRRAARQELTAALRLNSEEGGLTQDDLADANRLLGQVQGDLQ